MAYEKYYENGWQSGETGGTPIVPDALNHMEQGILGLESSKAPAGYGYGDTMTSIVATTTADSDAQLANIYGAMPDMTCRQLTVQCPELEKGYYTFCGTLYRSDSNYGWLKVMANYNGLTVQKTLNSGTWGEWEWVNPPMEAGVEYRTTERYKGKPVYAQLVDCGVLPIANAAKEVSFADNGVTIVIAAEMCSARNDGAAFTFPFYFTTTPTEGFNFYLGKYKNGVPFVRMRTNGDFSDSHGYALARYCRT